MKIKTKKQLNLPQLIEWAWENGIKSKHYVSEHHYIVTFDKIGFLENSTLPLDEIFTVEVEEEITEDTVLPKLVKYTCNSYYEHIDKSINMLDRAKEWSTFYYKDDNENMHLIWRDGKLVE